MSVQRIWLPLLIGLLAVAGNSSFGREWTDSTGEFSVEAELLQLKDGKVRLRRKDGRTITVPLSKLSKKDLQYLAALARSLKKPPAEESASNEPVGANLPDLNKSWDLKDLYVVVQWLKEQSKVDETKLPRRNSAVLQKVLSPATLQSVIRAEEDVKQLATAPNARAQYLQAYQVYFGAGVKDYPQEAAALLKSYQHLLWADLDRFHKSLATRASLAKSFDNNARGFCRLAIGHTAVARTHFPANEYAYFQAFAIHYYPRAFRMQSEESRALTAKEFFQFKEGTESQLKFAKGNLHQRYLSQKRMVEQIEAAIQANIPRD